MLVQEIIERIAPEFSSVNSDELQEWIDIYSPMVSKNKFGKMYDLALAYYVCHKMKLAGKGKSVAGGFGNLSDRFGVSSISDGGTSISFNLGASSQQTTDAEFTMTSYGVQFLNIRKTAIIPITIDGGGVIADT